ncbi:hypothetical protein A0H81_14526 [Grifola frondosa]|uniref:Uncharacterized protein n=1 Tax=Grifola frondosa TaxID=5627 RepID=A0A1C7LKV7_GRIFR|nr:hypothetical protein A0H81_14526 [Grifola frondosa]
MLSHAYAVKLYREEFQTHQGEQIGITLNGDWAIPYDDSPENIEAAQHALDVTIGTSGPGFPIFQKLTNRSPLSVVVLWHQMTVLRPS